MNEITLKKLVDIEAYAGPNAIDGIRFRPARPALGISSWGMNVLELDPNCANYPEHHHGKDNHEEVYVVLRGSVFLQAKGEEWRLDAGDMVRVAPPVSRKFVTREAGATLLAIGGTPGKPYEPSMGG